MFQDEGRFGLLGNPRRCWAPSRVRPIVGARLERKDLYAFSAVSPHDGVMDSLVLPWVNAETMSLFLAEVAQRHASEFVCMVMDQAGWHVAGELTVPPKHAVDVPAAVQPRTHTWVPPACKAFAHDGLKGSIAAIHPAFAAAWCRWP